MTETDYTEESCVLDFRIMRRNYRIDYTEIVAEEYGTIAAKW